MELKIYEYEVIESAGGMGLDGTGKVVSSCSRSREGVKANSNKELSN